MVEELQKQIKTKIKQNERRERREKDREMNYTMILYNEDISQKVAKILRMKRVTKKHQGENC